MGLIKGIPVKLYVKTKTGVDDFNHDVYEMVPVTVQNVLVALPESGEVLESTNLSGREIAFTLGIPKGDRHDWIDTDVEFFGERFHTVGDVMMGIEAMVPLDWHKKIRVVRTNG